MGRVLVKLTVWEEYQIDDDLLEGIDFETEEGIDYVLDECFSADSEILYDTFEDMPLSENQGFSTLEIYDDAGNLLYANGNT